MKFVSTPVTVAVHPEGTNPTSDEKAIYVELREKKLKSYIKLFSLNGVVELEVEQLEEVNKVAKQLCK